ncbi:hypothetical protein LR48_Vigan647s000900 [Vigna angularis]|uniref:TIR domain-containing protein n=1 Tax=Phaseolus angularis TaxID=3914 RepID=A0A0L9TFH5_PHAAN|nr:hypothetical protein LR48_Vigan647s000900 [Vigna angularis]
MPLESDVTISSYRLCWDVFLSFRGTHTGHTFTMRLYHALHGRGVRVFRNDDGLERRGEIQKKLLEAVEDSAAAVVVISPDYASSHWCLEELAKICEVGRLILPVFYWVDPSHVRKQEGPFEEWFVWHAQRFPTERVEQWRDAMKKVGGLAGFVLDEKSDGDKSDELIQILVQNLMKQLRNTPLSVAPFTVGLDDRVEVLKNLLDLKSNDVRVLGLYGMGGVGKTTLAKSLFNNLVVHSFERRSFIPNVRSQVSKHHGLVSLQNKIHGDLCGRKEDLITDVSDGISAIQKIVQENRVLLILDDVDDVEQLNFLMGKREWFYKGSRVVITTRDKEILHGSYVDVDFEVKELEFSEAMELFCFHAIRRKEPAEVMDLSESLIETLWKGRSNKVAVHLTVLNLSRCHRLTATPDLSGYLSLKKLNLEECSHLTRIHESLGNLNSLVHLNFRLCYNLIELPSDVSGLKHLEDLVLSDCWKLKTLPKDLSCMVSLRQLLLDSTSITELPLSIFHLTKLEKLSANGCHLLKKLPTCTGKLCSLQELSLNHTALEELPDSVGSLEKLEMLSLTGCKSLSVIPNSTGKLISLTQLYLDGSGIKELPASIGALSYLRKLSVGDCTSLDKFPVSMEALVSIVELKLDGTKVSNFPDEIFVGMKMLEKLEMGKVQHLKFVPVSLGYLSALTILDMHDANITELPESIGMLENLIRLRLDKCKQLQRLPDSIGNLKSLRWLMMKETALTRLPDSFGMLRSLVELDMKRMPYLNGAGNNMSTGTIIPEIREQPSSEAILTSFCNLSLLEKLNAHGWGIYGKIPDEFEKLSSLETLSLGHNNICSLPASMTGLSCLKKLLLSDCRELMFLPPLPSSLEELNLENCVAVQYIHDISNLERLEEFNLTNCEKVVDVPGLEHLKSLRRLYMSGCIGCSLAVKRRFSKVLLKKLEILIMPGSRVPDWLTAEPVVFSKRSNRELKGVIFFGVISFKNIPENQREGLELVDVQGKIFNLTSEVFSTTFRLLRVPRTNEDHIFLRRFGARTPLVFQLKDRYTLHLQRRNPPRIERLELNNCRIHLVFYGDDDYEGDEGSLEESQYSVSQKLAKFFNFAADDPGV